MDRVMAGLTKNHAIVEPTCATEFDMPDVMSLGSFTKSMGALANLAKSENACSAAGACIMLPSQSLLLSTKREFAGSLGHPRTS
jgi:hypothetical protein